VEVVTKIKQILNSKIGIDKAVGYTLSARIIQAFGSFVSLYLIALYLTKEEQGFYYTFGSILAIQVFFELGLNGIITQYAAHESAQNLVYNISKSIQELDFNLNIRLFVRKTY
jgi:O-antigen/teichoic acid export membrane protein